MSDYYENLLLELAPLPIADTITNNSSIPTLGHCIGTGKLLGEFYGDAICEIFKIRDTKTRQMLTKLSVLMRAFIVLDDSLKDRTSISIVDYENCIRRWLDNIKRKAIATIDELGDDGQKLWEKYYSRYELGYQKYFKTSLYDATMQKCSFLFLPFELSLLFKQKDQCEKVKKTVGYYLFSLQLLDDFHDMEEDLIAPKNHNLFIASLSNENQKKLVCGRSALVKFLTSYIESNLKTTMNDSSGSKIFDKYLYKGIEWLNSVRSLFLKYPSINIFKGDYRDYMLTDDEIQPHSKVLETAAPVDISLISAEAMHTAYS